MVRRRIGWATTQFQEPQLVYSVGTFRLYGITWCAMYDRNIELKYRYYVDFSAKEVELVEKMVFDW